MLITSASDYPLISVLIPAYNHARYIRSCLDSILSDGYPNLEVIVLDDGSTDETYRLADEWFSTHGHRLNHYILMRQDNQGVTKTLNTLLRTFTSEYLVLLASDDMLLKGGIEARLATLKGAPKALAIFADCIGIDEAGKKICSSVLVDKFHANVSALSNCRTRPYELILNWCIPGPVYLAKREVLKKIGYYDEAFRVEDRDYYLKLIASDALAFTASKVAAYRLHDAASTGTRERQVQVGLEVMRIELHNLDRFMGLKRTALWLALRGNSANFRRTTGIKVIIPFMQTAIARSAALGYKYMARLVAYIDGKMH
ncbi:glycosyltransferase family A protein [Polaromonas sp.]|uniref:glycosyltransferase family A protein n=1 Tax=Polaromonas sp. TaxID=1869339 RepID=UPI0025D00346|nr:glycosyltransferase family A protein [Polaromonas sp.]